MPSSEEYVDLLKRIQERTALISVIGLGYVGLPLAVEFARAGFKVVGIDTDQEKVQKVNAGRSYIRDVHSEVVESVVQSGKLRASVEYAPLEGVDAAVICVPTPLDEAGDPDLSFVLSATQGLANYLHQGMLVVLESTVYPGGTQECVVPILEVSGLRVGEEFHVAFSPERIDPGNKTYGLGNTPKIVGGVTPGCLEAARALYETIIEAVVPVSSTKTAETVKLFENSFRAVNIGFVNEMAVMCDKLGLDVWEIIEAASTKPFGFMPFYPGPGIGGHCIPVDPAYLAWKLGELGCDARFIRLARQINSAMPRHVVGKVVGALHAMGKSINGSRVMILGVAYKADVDDVRESPALEILRLLRDRGAEVMYNDPFVSTLHVDGMELQSVELDRELLGEMDCLVIVAGHSGYDWEDIVAASSQVVDTRNATKGTTADRRKIVNL